MTNFLVLLLFFCSGLLALVYEVLWMKELGLLFGNSAFAAATTLAAFFLGLAVGGYFWGQRAVRLKNPLKTYGFLEIAVAISVLGYFLILDGYHALYPLLFRQFASTPWMFVLVKFHLAMLLLFPAAFFIGGTFPVIAQFSVRGTSLLGQKVSILYCVNTLGAAMGALLAGFYLPRHFGYSVTYVMAVVATAVIGVTALLVASNFHDKEASSDKPISGKLVPASIPMHMIRVLALLSGFGTLALQVLWTRMFAQVLQNSVYTFATILVIFLLCLSAGAALAHRMIKSGIEPRMALFGIFVSGAILTGLTPFLFNEWTDGLNYIGADFGWYDYLLQVFKLEFIVMGLPVLILGAIFPFLLKIAEPCDTSSGRLVGHLSALNTIGAIFGSIIAGFVILNLIGVWSGIRLVSGVYLLGSMYLIYVGDPKRRGLVIIPSLSFLLLVLGLETSNLPVVRVDSDNGNERLLDVWESSSGTTAVVLSHDNLKIKVNNHYALGGSGSKSLEALEGRLPTVLHPDPKSVFFLGMGTGISAGAVLNFPIDRLVVAELIPEVVQAASKYFGPYNNKLFSDPRVQVVEEDGRNFLAGNSEKFDLVIADLFIPWRAGAGSLYSIEHYRSVRQSLNEAGLFMQWLPAYQLSEIEFSTIARTMAEVFPQISLWRGDFSASQPVVGLLAQTDERPLAANASIFSKKSLQHSERNLPLFAFYVGNLENIEDRLMRYPINSDDKPVIEYRAPISHRQQSIAAVKWLTSDSLLKYMERITEAQSIDNDPYLQNMPVGANRFPEAGMDLFRGQVLRESGMLSAAKKAYAQFKNTLNFGSVDSGSETSSTPRL